MPAETLVAFVDGLKCAQCLGDGVLRGFGKCPSCDGGKNPAAQAALTTWRERAPLREDRELVRDVMAIMACGRSVADAARLLNVIDAHVLGPREADKSRGT